jgi:mono/diheme cytochrome c family protein
MARKKVAMHMFGAVAAVALFCFTAAPLSAQDFDPGRALYEHHCQHCHAQWVHERDGRRVTTLGGLRQQVASWSVHAGLRWTSEEIDLVTRYVNRRFYQLTD